MSDDRALRDATGQWWGTSDGHYLLRITEAVAKRLGGRDDQDDDALMRASIEQQTTGTPVELTPWKPDVDLPAPVDRFVARDGDVTLAILERADGRLTLVNEGYLVELEGRCPADLGYGLAVEQLGGQTAPVRFMVGETPWAYLMPVIDRKAVPA